MFAEDCLGTPMTATCEGDNGTPPPQTNASYKRRPVNGAKHSGISPPPDDLQRTGATCLVSSCRGPDTDAAQQWHAPDSLLSWRLIARG